MCGIVGTIGGELNDAMIQAIKHRGYSKYLYLTNKEQIAFYHLPILDEKNGSQPFSYDGWKCFFNGEIYNAKELALRHEIQLDTNCDTEIICKLVSKLGVAEAVKSFNGMFAIYLWNDETNQKYLIRDRFGIKPMYYCRIGGNLYFSSELKAFRLHPDFKKELNMKAVVEYLRYQNILSDRTLYKTVRLLPPSTIFHIHLGVYQEYWKPEIKEKKIDFIEASHEVRRLLNQSIKRQLVSDVPIGSFLSGGVDSNIINSLAGDSITHTFTAGFTHGKSEHEIAEMNKAKNHDSVLFGSDSIKNLISDTIYHLEDLRCGASYTNFYLYSVAKKKGINVLMQGTGGDELFGGYTHRYDMSKDYRSILNRNKIYEDDSIEWENDSLKSRMEFDLRHFMHGLLIVGDKLSMAHTIEDRVPFLDNDLVDFALTIPLSMKKDKWILKYSCLDILSNEVVNAPKWGFTSPEHIWMEMNKEWVDWQLLHVRDIMDIPEERNPSLNWSLLSLEYWIKHYIL